MAPPFFVLPPLTGGRSKGLSLASDARKAGPALSRPLSPTATPIPEPGAKARAMTTAWSAASGSPVVSPPARAPTHLERQPPDRRSGRAVPLKSGVGFDVLPVPFERPFLRRARRCPIRIPARQSPGQSIAPSPGQGRKELQDARPPDLGHADLGVHPCGRGSPDTGVGWGVGYRTLDPRTRCAELRRGRGAAERPRPAARA